MGREVRRVPAGWQHPKRDDGRDGYRPLMDGYNKAKVDWEERVAAKGLQDAIDYFGRAPDMNDYMPDWPEAERTHLMMYEDTSEGTPISPAFATPEELARWLADAGASAFGRGTATYEQWLAMCKAGWAPSAAVVDGRFMSGVELAAR